MQHPKLLVTKPVQFEGEPPRLCDFCDRAALVTVEAQRAGSTYRATHPFAFCLEHADELVQGVTTVVLEHLNPWAVVIPDSSDGTPAAR